MSRSRPVQPRRAWLHTLILDESTSVDPLRALDISRLTKRNYEDASWPVRERLGARPLQSITKAHVEDLVDSSAPQRIAGDDHDD